MESHNTLFFLFLLLVLTTAPLETYARDSQFFSKVSRTTPQASDPKPVTQTLSPSAATPVFTKSADERGYGLFAAGETYEYPPTTTNPTKSKPADRNIGKLVEGDQGHEGFFQGERSETGEKQGRVYGTTGEKQGRVYGTTGEKQGRVYGTTGEKQGRLYGNRGQKQGMSDTRFLENGKYFYDIEAEKMSNSNGYSDSYKYRNEEEKMSNNNGYSDSYKYRNEEEEEEEEEGGDKYGIEEEEQGNNRAYGKQGMSDTRFLENGKYYYDVEAERKNNVAFYDRNSKYEGEGNNGEELVYRKERYAPEEAKYSVRGGSSSPNKFPRYEFDSMEEYEKYEEGRSHQKEYGP